MILIADDNRQMRQTLKDILRELDPLFCECGTGREAIELYRIHHPDWVLMDVKMPEMDGITATRLIMESFPLARILIVSNYSDAQLQRDAAAAGASRFVLKDDLSQLLAIILNHNRSRDER